MADRTVNININYKVNTADVTKAAAAAAQAQKATEALRKSTQQYGTTAATAGKQASTGLNSVSGAAKTASTSTQNLSNSFGSLATTVTAIIAAGLTKEVLDIALSMARLAGNVEGVERAFKRAFPNSVAVLGSLRDATKGTISDLELMQRTLQATNLGVAVEQLPQLFEFAAARAQQTGESVDYLVDSIVRGIGRKSPLILDNLGISAIRLKEKFNGAALAAQSVGDVTKAVAEIAGEEMTKMGGFVATSATKVDALIASWENLRAAVAKRLEPGTSALTSFLDDSIEGLRLLITSNKDLLLQESRRVAAADALRIVQSKEYKEFGDNQQAKFDLLQQEINSRVQIIGRYNDNIALLKEEQKIIFSDVSKTKRVDQITKEIKALEGNKVVLASTILALKEYLKQIELINEVDKKDEQSGIIERKKKQIEDLQKQIEKTNNINDLRAGGKLISQLEIAQAELGDLLRAFRDFHIKEFKLEIEEASGTLTDFDEVTNRIEETLKRGFTVNIPKPKPTFEPTFWDNLKDEVEENWRDITASSIDIQTNQLNSILEADLNNMRARLDASREFYASQETLAGNNERHKQELRVKSDRETAALQKKIFEREKSVRRAQALIDGAGAIVKAFVTAPNVYVAIVQAALIAAQTAAQLAIINRQQPRFAKGVIGVDGPGTGTSDSIPVRVSKGESIIRADRTEKSRNLLTAINDGKISDKEISPDILNRLHVTNDGVKYEQFDDSRIVNELRKQQPVDYMHHANILWEVRTSADGLHKKIRRKSMGY